MSGTVKGCGFPRLRIETWGTQFRADGKEKQLRQNGVISEKKLSKVF
jgi:hypothetical protein